MTTHIIPAWEDAKAEFEDCVSTGSVFTDDARDFLQAAEERIAFFKNGIDNQIELKNKAIAQRNELKEEITRLQEALRLIKAAVVGEAKPHWDGIVEISHSRGWIADTCDIALKGCGNF